VDWCCEAVERCGWESGEEDRVEVCRHECIELCGEVWVGVCEQGYGRLWRGAVLTHTSP